MSMQTVPVWLKVAKQKVEARLGALGLRSAIMDAKVNFLMEQGMTGACDVHDWLKGIGEDAHYFDQFMTIRTVVTVLMANEMDCVMSDISRMVPQPVVVQCRGTLLTWSEWQSGASHRGEYLEIGRTFLDALPPWANKAFSHRLLDDHFAKPYPRFDDGRLYVGEFSEVIPFDRARFLADPSLSSLALRYWLDCQSGA